MIMMFSHLCWVTKWYLRHGSNILLQHVNIVICNYLIDGSLLYRTNSNSQMSKGMFPANSAQFEI